MMDEGAGIIQAKNSRSRGMFQVVRTEYYKFIGQYNVALYFRVLQTEYCYTLFPILGRYSFPNVTHII